MRVGTTVGLVALVVLAAAPGLALVAAATFVLGVASGLTGPGFTAGGSLAGNPAEQGGVAGVLAGVGASAIGWVLAEQVFRMPYVPALAPVLVGVVLGAVGVVAGGWLGTRTLLSRPPLASLRALG